MTATIGFSSSRWRRGRRRRRCRRRYGIYSSSRYLPASTTPGSISPAVGSPLFGSRRRLLGAQLRLHPGEHHGEVEGLGDVVVGAELQGLDHRLALGLGGRHDHRQLGLGVGPGAGAEDLDPVDARHHDVEQHQVDRLAVDDGLERARSPSSATRTPKPLRCRRRDSMSRFISLSSTTRRVASLSFARLQFSRFGPACLLVVEGRVYQPRRRIGRVRQVGPPSALWEISSPAVGQHLAARRLQAPPGDRVALEHHAPAGGERQHVRPHGGEFGLRHFDQLYVPRSASSCHRGTGISGG